MDTLHRLRAYLVISDDTTFRQHLRQILAESLNDACLLADDDLAAALPLAMQLQPDLTLIDASGARAHELLHALGSIRAETRHLLFAPVWNETAMVDTLVAGGHGCLPRNAPALTCLAAVRAVTTGDLWVPRNIITGAMARMRRQSPSAATPDALTRRERDVAAAASQGLDNKQIAHALGMSPATVKTHLHHVFAKLGTNRRGLIMQGVRRPG